MKFLNNRYAKIFSHKGFDICTLKSACPEKGDTFRYAIDGERFNRQGFSTLADAIEAIDLQK